MSNYVALLKLPFNGTTYNVGFKRTGFIAEYAMRGPVDVLKLAEKDKAVYDSRYMKANEKKKPDLENDFSLTPVVAGYLKAYSAQEEKKTLSTGLFDIMTDPDFAEAALPPKAELSVQIEELAAENASKDERIKALEAQLSDPKK